VHRRCLTRSIATRVKVAGLGKSRKWAIWSGAPFSVIFDFPLDSFGIHAFYHSISRVVYMGWVRDVGGVDSRSRRDLEVQVYVGKKPADFGPRFSHLVDRNLKCPFGTKVSSARATQWRIVFCGPKNDHL
jgi:hypothetical protein